MSKTLDELLTKAYEDNEKEIKAQTSIEPDDTEFMFESVKERISSKIYSEIKEEVYEEIMEKVNEDLKKHEHDRKIEELRKVIYSGFIIAFFVGLLVNQVTDIASYIKKSLELEWGITIILIVFLAIISIGLTVYKFVDEGLKLIRK